MLNVDVFVCVVQVYADLYCITFLLPFLGGKK